MEILFQVLKESAHVFLHGTIDVRPAVEPAGDELQDGEVGGALVAEFLVHQVASLGKEVGVLAAYVIKHLLLGVASCIHQQFHILGNAARNHVQAQKVFIPIVRRMVLEYLFQHSDGEGTEGEFGGGATIEGFILVLEDAFHQ